MSTNQPDSGSRGKHQVSSNTANRWTVIGGITGLVSAVPTVFGYVEQLLPLLIIGGGLLLVAGCVLSWRTAEKQAATGKLTPMLLMSVLVLAIGGGLVGVGIANNIVTPTGNAAEANPPSQPSQPATTSRSPETTSTPRTSATFPPRTSSVGGATTSSPALSVKRRSGTATVTMFYSIDLDSMDENWGNAKSGSQTGDFFYNGTRSISTPSDTVKASKDATRDTCNNSTGLKSGINSSDYGLNDTFCLKTGEDRWALVTFTATNADKSAVTIEILVWEK